MSTATITLLDPETLQRVADQAMVTPTTVLRRMVGLPSDKHRVRARVEGALAANGVRFPPLPERPVYGVAAAAVRSARRS